MAADDIVAQPAKKSRLMAIGPVGLLLILMISVWLLAVNGSTLLPGSWSNLEMPMLVYILMATVALGVFARASVVPVVSEGSVGRFAKTYGVFSALTFVVMILFLRLGPATPTPVTGTAQFQDIVFIALFVGPVEELFFRVVLPPFLGATYFSQMVFSSALFAGFHAAAYTASGVSWTGISLLEGLVEVALLGTLFYAIAWKRSTGPRSAIVPRYGIAATAAIHTNYDLAVLGVIGFLPAAAHLLGLVWI